MLQALNLKDRNALGSLRRGCPDFPAPIRLGKRTIAWFEDEVLAWLESQQRVPAWPGREVSA